MPLTPPAPPTPPTLFRPQVLATRQTQWLGSVLLAPRASHRLFVLFGLLTASAIVALLALGDYTRKARIDGWLVPRQGMVRVFAPRPGVVASLHVAEGAAVRQGEPLLTLSDELQSAALGATQAEIGRRLAERRQSLVEERAQQERLLAQQQRALGERIAALRDEEAQVGRELAVMDERIAIAARAEELHRRLNEQGFISEQRLQGAAAETLEQRARRGALERSRLAARRERLQLEAQRQELPFAAQKAIAVLERSIAELQQARAEAEARREIVVAAPQDGTVTAIQAVLGVSAAPGVPLLSIVPADTRLEAHLYSPSRAVGFVRPGQRVLLRYQAFPYQRFGHHEGVVASVARSAISPGEQPPQLASLTGLSGAAAANAAAEPMYRITVNLDRQAITAYGEQVRLQPGMLLQADVALEQRKLYEWVLDPLYTVTGKWRG